MFDMDENTAVITTKDIMNNKKRVVLVFHDTDEIWQFLDGGEVSNENAAVVSISEMEQLEPSICELCGLPSGGVLFVRMKPSHGNGLKQRIPKNRQSDCLGVNGGQKRNEYVHQRN